MCVKGMSPAAMGAHMCWFGLVREARKKVLWKALGVRSAKWPGANGVERVWGNRIRPGVPGAERARGSVGVCLTHRRVLPFPQKNGKPLKTFKKRNDIIIVVGIRTILVALWQTYLRGKQQRVLRSQWEGDGYTVGRSRGARVDLK